MMSEVTLKKHKLEYDIGILIYTVYNNMYNNHEPYLQFLNADPHHILCS